MLFISFFFFLVKADFIASKTHRKPLGVCLDVCYLFCQSIMVRKLPRTEFHFKHSLFKNMFLNCMGTTELRPCNWRQTPVMLRQRQFHQLLYVSKLAATMSAWTWWGCDFLVILWLCSEVHLFDFFPISTKVMPSGQRLQSLVHKHKI